MKLGTQNWPSPSRELGLGGWDAPTHTHTCYLDEREGGTVIYVLTTNPLLLIRRYCSDRMLSGWAGLHSVCAAFAVPRPPEVTQVLQQ